MYKTIGGRPAAGQARFARLKPEFVINKYYLETLRYLTVRRDECATAYTIGRFAVSAVACILARSLYIKALSVYRRCDVLSAAHRVVERPYDLVHAYDHKNMRRTERKACYAVPNAVDIYDNAVLAHSVAARQEKVSGIVAAHYIHALLHIVCDLAVECVVIPVLYSVVQSDSLSSHRTAPADRAALRYQLKRLSQRSLSAFSVISLMIAAFERLYNMRRKEFISLKSHTFHIIHLIMHK